MSTFDPLPPEAFPIQCVDRVLFSATHVLLCVMSDAATAQEVAARLNASELWRNGVTDSTSPEEATEPDEPGWTLSA